MKNIIVSIVVIILIIIIASILLIVNTNKANEIENNQIEPGMDEYTEDYIYDDIIEEEYLDLFGDNIILLYNGNNKMDSDSMNLVRTNSKFYVSLSPKIEQIEEVSYWFDDNEPTDLSDPYIIPELVSRDTYSKLSIRIKYDNKETIISYNFEILGYIVGVIEEKEIDNDGETVFVIDGNKYIVSTYKEVEIGNIGFLYDLYDNQKYVCMCWIDPKTIDSQRQIVNSSNGLYELTKFNNGGTSEYTIDNIYQEFALICYFEYDNEFNIKYTEVSNTRNKDMFELLPGDRIVTEKANLGCFSIFRKYEDKKDRAPFFSKNNNSINISTYPSESWEENVDRKIFFDRNLTSGEKLIISLNTGDKTIDFYNDYYKNKEYEIKGKELFDTVKQIVPDPDGVALGIDIKIVSNENKIIAQKSFTTRLYYANKLKIFSNFEEDINNDKSISISFDRKIREYEKVEIGIELYVSDDTSSINVLSKEYNVGELDNNLADLMTINEDGSVIIDKTKLNEKIVNSFTNNYSIRWKSANFDGFYIEDNKKREAVNFDLSNNRISLYVYVTAQDDFGVGNAGGAYLIAQDSFDGNITLGALIKNKVENS